MNELISIIIPAYNAEKYIERCIRSVFNQTYVNLEIIVINDGSNDNTISIINDLKKEDKRLRIISKDNEGVSRARNDGLKIANGQYIGFLDSDDYYYNSFIETLYQKIMEDSSNDAATLIDFTIKDNNLANNTGIDSQIALDYLCQMEFPTSAWAYLYKRKLLDNIKFNPEILFFEDFLFNYKVISKANNIGLVSGKLYFYEDNPEGANLSLNNKNKLTALSIPSILKKDKSVGISKYFYNAYAHFIISSALYISKSDVDSKELYKLIKYHSKKCIKKLAIGNTSIVYYNIILCIYISPKLAIKVLEIYNKLKL